jgi:S1-C subfamily serine protease
MEHAMPAANREDFTRRRRRFRLALPTVVVTATVLVAACGSGGSGSESSSAARASSVQTQFVNTVHAVLPSVVEVRSQDGLGSGIVIDTSGNIVTNRHVVGSAQSLQVRASSGKSFSASLVGASAENDLAVIRVQGANLPPATLGDSSKLHVGDLVLAVGNPLGLASSVTNGLVSALGRTVDESSTVALRDLIQTSAPINPGNSGGALVDVNGRVVGIPTLAAVDPENNQAAEGIGFAIPSNSVKSIAGKLLAAGTT